MPSSTVERHPHPKYERLYVIRRSRSKFWYAETFLDGRKVRKSLKTSPLPTAFKLAEDWYRRELRASVQFGRQHPIERLTSDPVLGELFVSYTKSLDKPQRAEADKQPSASAIVLRC
jgi:hypothetical protein